MADPSTPPASATLETLQARHRKEQRDLVSQTTQKKKQASKKTRKSVNEECERLERELKERQATELARFNGEDVPDDHEDLAPLASDPEDETSAIEDSVSKISINGTITPQSQDTNGNPEGNGGGRKKKPNRAKARLARRAEEQSAMIAQAEREAANAPNPRELERERMATQLQQHKLSLHEIRADGHCLYAAVADQIKTRELGLTPQITVTKAEDNEQEYKKVRYAAADWIAAHADDFAGFMEDELPEHVRKIKETGEWGGHLELLALARNYGVQICVLHSDGRVDRIEPEEGKKEERQEIWLGYYKHSHGLGEHYNSLRKAG